MSKELLIPRDQYLASGIHIGMKQRTAQMKDFIYQVRPDGLAVLDVNKIDNRIRVTAKFLARLKNVLVVSRRSAAQEAVEKFGEVIGAKTILGRFMPGTLTNPNYKNYFEADAVFVMDPLNDIQSLKEAVSARIPVIAVADTINEIRNIDLVIPANNKGKKSLVTLLWLLAREIAKARGTVKSDEEFSFKLADFGLTE
ncbi:30S ribosomal protein S2 [archaeon]|nr:MAG: 30S ribosomal protein S2 [archaeon]